MSDVKINYYEVLKKTPMWEMDEMNKVALPIKMDDDKNVSIEKGKNIWTVDKGQYVKSFGQTRTLKTPDNKKEEFLLLVNGSGILVKDVTLYKDEVDDCGCDGNPIALPTEVMKAMEAENEKNNNTEHKPLDKESAYVNKTSKFDKSGLVGFLLGAAIGGGIMWYVSKKDKKKTIIGAVAGAFLGMIIGYFIGRRGTRKMETVKAIEQMEKTTNSAPKTPSAEKEQKPQAEKQEFLQLGQSYDFSIPYPVYAMLYENEAFYVAKDNTGNKMILKPGTKVRGKLVEVKEPQVFVANPATKKVEKIKNNKPLPFLLIGDNLFIPLSVVEPSAAITTEEAMKYLSGAGGLEDEVYVKGRYAGKRLYNLMYLPAYAVILKEKFGA